MEIKKEINDERSRPKGHQRFERFVDLANVVLRSSPERDISNSQDRIDFIKQIEPSKFFDLLASANSLLRNKKLSRWEGKAKMTLVGMGGGDTGIDLEPPDNAEKEFEKFLIEMKKNIAVENLDVWSAKLYTAINLAHMFPDGNGRLSRNFYSLMKSGKILDETKSSKRTKELMDYATLMKQEIILQIFRNDGISKKRNFAYLEREYAAGETKEDVMIFDIRHLTRYIAAKRILQKHGEFKPNKKRIFIKDWSNEYKEELKKEYQQVKKEFFWEGIKTVDRYSKWCVNKLDQSLIDSDKNSPK